MMCQAVAEATGEVDPAAAFTVGLFSGLEDLLGVPMDHAVAGLHLDGALHDALATRTGPLGELLATAVDYQLGAVGPGSPGQSPVWLQAFADALNWVAPLRPMLYHPE
jgi:hypothetical protein